MPDSDLLTVRVEDRLVQLIRPYVEWVTSDELHPVSWELVGDRQLGDMWHQRFDLEESAPVDVWITDEDSVLIAPLAPDDDWWVTEFPVRGAWEWVDSYRCQDCGTGRHLPGGPDCPLEAL